MSKGVFFFSTVGERYTKQETELVFDKTTQRACAEINAIDDGKKEEDESFLVLLVTIKTHLVSLNPRIPSVTIQDYDGYGKLSIWDGSA